MVHFYLCSAIDRSHVTAAIWWPLGVAVVSVTCMRVRWPWVSHTWKYTQWNIFLFESSHKSPYWTKPYHVGFRYEASLNFHTYFGQCPNDTYILLHIPLHVCPSYPHTGITTATAPNGHQMAVVRWDQSIVMLFSNFRWSIFMFSFYVYKSINNQWYWNIKEKVFELLQTIRYRKHHTLFFTFHCVGIHARCHMMRGSVKAMKSWKRLSENVMGIILHTTHNAELGINGLGWFWECLQL